MREERRIAPLAEAQLAAWQVIAADWPVTGPSGLCGVCGKGVILRADAQGRPYRYTPEQVLAHIVLHLRSHHPDLDPDKP